jgi:hypothetical protein
MSGLLGQGQTCQPNCPLVQPYTCQGYGGAGYVTTITNKSPYFVKLSSQDQYLAYWFTNAPWGQAYFVILPNTTVSGANVRIPGVGAASPDQPIQGGSQSQVPLDIQVIGANSKTIAEGVLANDGSYITLTSLSGKVTATRPGTNIPWTQNVTLSIASDGTLSMAPGS